MKCMSCGAPISPAFKSAIQNNICPACGGEIMNEATLELLDELKDALEEMPNDPEGLAGWLLSNYEMRKIGTGEPVGQFYGSAPQRLPQQGGHPQQGGGQPLPSNPHYQQFTQQGQRPNTIGGPPGSMMDKEAQLRAQPKVAQNKLQQFYANAGIKPKNQQKYAALAQQIQGDGDGPDYGDSEMDYSDEPYDHGGVPAEAQDPDFTSAVLEASSGMERPMTREDRMALQRMMTGGGDGNGDDYDPSLPPALNHDRMDRLRKQQDLAMGGKVGKISRSS